MSIKATLLSDGMEVYTAPTLKEMCLYKCLKNKEILTKEVEVDNNMDGRHGSKKLDWEKFRLKEPVQRDLVKALLDAGEKYLFMLTPMYQPVLAAIRMSQPEHLVKVHVNNTASLKDWQLEFLISGGNVKSLDINGCRSLGIESLQAINKCGNNLEYLRLGNSGILPHSFEWNENSPILRTPNLKTFIISELYGDFLESDDRKMTIYMRFLLQDFIINLEDLQISSSERFETLEFLEPARNKLSALTLRDCTVMDSANAWESLFKLDKLRFLDVVESSMGIALDGQNVVQRLLKAMPNLTHLAVDSGLVNAMHVEAWVRGQGSVAKRLDFLGIMDNVLDEDELRTAKLLANDVAYFSAMEGDLRILEYYSNRLNIGDCKYALEWLLIQASNMMAPSMTVISLLLNTLKNNGVTTYPELFFQYLKKLFTPDVASKLSEIHLDQCFEVIYACVDTCSAGYVAQPEPLMISDVIDIVLNLDGRLRFDHYANIVSMVVRMVIVETLSSRWDCIGRKGIRALLRKVAQLLEKARDRFPEDASDLWGISSVLVVTKKLKDVIVSGKLGRIHLLEIFGSIITSLAKLCLKSGPHRPAFHWIIVEWLNEIDLGVLGFANRDSFALLEILKSILQDQDTKLNPFDPCLIAFRLEKLLLSIHSKWKFWKSNPVQKTTHYDQLEIIVNLLSFLESDPRCDYEASADAKDIMMELK